MSDDDGVDLVELTDELWSQSTQKHLNEMLVGESGKQRFVDGSFWAGWSSAVEEIAARMGIEIEMP